MQGHNMPSPYPPYRDPLREWRFLLFLCWALFLPALLVSHAVEGGIRWLLRWRAWSSSWYWWGVTLASILGGLLFALLGSWRLLGLVYSQALAGGWLAALGLFLLFWGSLVLFAPLMLVVKLLPDGTPESALLREMEQRKSPHKQTNGQAPSGTIPDDIDHEPVLGTNVGGDFPEWERAGGLCIYPREVLTLPGVMIGESRSGKTTTALRLAYLAVRLLGWDVIYLDCKGDELLARDFVAAMRRAGLQDREIGMFPWQAYNGWVGDARAIINRLDGIVPQESQYYHDMYRLMVELAVKAKIRLPRRSKDLLEQMRLDRLLTYYKERPELVDVESIHRDEANGARNRVLAFFSALEGDLDGSWSLDQARASYFLLRGLALRQETATLGRFFIEEIANYAAMRKERDKPVLVLIDDASALRLRSEAAGLVERLAGYNAAVLIIAQSYESLGPHAAQMIGAAGVRYLHRCSDPEAVIRRAGMQYEVRTSLQKEGGQPTGREQITIAETSRIHPDTIKRLETGELVVITRGKAHHVGVAPLAFWEHERHDATQYLDSLRSTSVKKKPASPLPTPRAGGTSL